MNKCIQKAGNKEKNILYFQFFLFFSLNYFTYFMYEKNKTHKDTDVNMSVYVCSDLHGNYKKWKRLLKEIKFSDDDEMYVLGDVIDRGDDPIPLLKDILARKNCHLILGNHEKMMLDFYFSKTDEEVASSYELWARNGGEITLSQCSVLPKEELWDIINKLKALPLLIIGLEVPFKDNKVKKYYLSHSLWGNCYYPDNSTDYNLDYLEKSEVMQILWNREYHKANLRPNIVLKVMYKDYTFISGHTPTYLISEKYRHRIYHSKHYMDIDCGAYVNLRNSVSVVGCIRLNDWKEFYVQ